MGGWVQKAVNVGQGYLGGVALPVPDMAYSLSCTPPPAQQQLIGTLGALLAKTTMAQGSAGWPQPPGTWCSLWQIMQAWPSSASCTSGQLWVAWAITWGPTPTPLVVTVCHGGPCPVCIGPTQAGSMHAGPGLVRYAVPASHTETWGTGQAAWSCPKAHSAEPGWVGPAQYGTGSASARQPGLSHTAPCRMGGLCQ